MGRRKFKVIALSLLAAFSTATTAISTIAWFKYGVTISFGDGSIVPINAGAEAAFFAGGDGSEDHPWEIANRTHLYNLAWLQYIGYFDGSDAKHPLQPYFVVTEDIDMTDITLPPIGTEEHPFVGNFDGGGNTISNLTVSNDDPKQASSDFGVTKPSMTDLNKTNNPPDVVGFFGVVGEYTSSFGGSYDSSIVSMTNFTLDSITVKSKTSKTLIGLAAGYVDGNVDSVKVSGSSSLTVNGQTAVDASNITSKLSDYGLVGYSTNVSKGNAYSQDLSEYYDHQAHSQSGGGDEWGSSISFKEFNTRLHNIINSSDTINAKFLRNNVEADRRLKYYSNEEIGLSIFRGGSRSAADTYLAQDPLNSNVIYNMVGGGQHQTKYSAGIYTTESVPGTYLPLTTTNGFDVADNNTGYIIGSNFAYGSSGHENASTDGTIRSASYANMQIAKSLGTTSYTRQENYNNNVYLTYDSSKFELLTNSSTTYGSSNFYRIKDTFNATNASVNSGISSYTKKDFDTDLHLKRYSQARNNLDSILAGASRVHGIHFMGGGVSSSKTQTIDNAKINGVSYNDYPLLLNSIDFNVKEEGYITLFAGSYYASTASSYAKSFFSLYKVTRNASNAITGVSEIKSIYKNDTTGDYVYYTNNESTSGCTKVFDLSYLTSTPPVENAVYYFEIPIGAGEFAIGSSASDGGYLFYLDIGASGEVTVPDDQITAYSITTKKQGNNYPLGVDFAVAGIGTGGGDSLGVYINSNSAGSISFAVNQAGTSIAIDDASSISTYAFHGTKYGGSNPASGQFSVSGSHLPGNITSPPVGGTRVLTIDLKKLGGTQYHIEITDYLTNSTGSFNPTESIYKLGGSTSSETAILALSEELDAELLATLRNLTIAATLTRNKGTEEFSTTYNTANCSYSGKTIDVDVVLNGTTLTLTVTQGYTLKIGGTSYSTIYPTT